MNMNVLYRIIEIVTMPDKSVKIFMLSCFCRACCRGIRNEMSKMYGSAKEERGEDSRVVHRESSRGVAGDGAKTPGRCEEVEHPLNPLMKPTD